MRPAVWALYVGKLIAGSRVTAGHQLRTASIIAKAEVYEKVAEAASPSVPYPTWPIRPQ
jgi:hypothetical protein